jgi:hypothetical protein
VEVLDMKTRFRRMPQTLTFIAAWLLLSVAGMARAEDKRVYSPEYTMSGPPHGAASVTLRRIADLGHNVFVRLWIDGQVAGPLIYGHTYETFLPPGRHVLSMAAGPGPKWNTPSEVLLDVRRNRAYNFTVTSNHAGRLTLKGEYFGSESPF